MGGERDQDIGKAATGAWNDPMIISMFRHPLGDPSNPDLSSRACSAKAPSALGWVHVCIFPLDRVSPSNFRRIFHINSCHLSVASIPCLCDSLFIRKLPQENRTPFIVYNIKNKKKKYLRYTIIMSFANFPWFYK